MAYANLSSLTKLHRATQIINDIGTNGFMCLYTGNIPPSPDIAPSGILIASLPLSATAGVASYALQNGIITSAGTGGTDGVYNLTITGGGGVGAAGTYTVVNGSVQSIAITVNGSGYTSLPTLSGFTTAGVSGAVVVPIMTATIVFNTISTVTSIATGTVGFVRIVTAGSVGVMDLDVGTTNSSSVVMNNLFVTSGSAVSCSADVLIEA